MPMRVSEPQNNAFDLATPITRVRSVGTRSAARLAKLGIKSVRQLLWHLPARYEDYSLAVPIADVIPGQKQSIQGEVISIVSRHIWPRRLTITTATLRDDSGAIRAVWFNQPYLEETLTEGTLLSVAGKMVLDKRGLYISNPIYEKIATRNSQLETSALRHTGRLIPIYPETEGVTSKYLRFLIQPLLESLVIPDPLPAAIRRQYDLTDLTDAIRTIHYPDTEEAVPAARDRLAFDDLLLLQLKALRERRQINKLRSVRIPMDAAYMRMLVATLPFTLTKDQRVATLEILRDMERVYPMNRLMEGDVGSGKTVVALLAALHGARLGHQTVLLAPTEVLALQHYRTLRTLAGSADIHTVLLTGSTACVDDRITTKVAAKRAVSTGQAHIVVGTHAVIRDDVRFKALALVVIDEQHRFGIEQRATLMKSDRHTSGLVPHLLSMTATPIPRTLALTIFGDLDISIIREKPKGRQPIETSVVSSAQRPQVCDFIRQQVHDGRQVFVICPAIEPSSPIVPTHASKTPKQAKLSALWAQVKAVEEEYRRLSKEVFPDLKVAMLHGRMKPAQKQSVMREFKEGWHDILVSTSVIEVGVDIPNASIMVVEGADRFGLAQLHQFRGRVGRAEHQSYCFLFSTDDTIGNRRLQAMTKTDDGFLLAEQDMRIRGPGEFFGIKQSGLPDLTMAALANVDLIKKARTAALAIMKIDPDLKRNPLLAAQLESIRRFSHLE
ncbi:MAG: ATP-dependent DNA helicase RecG [Patescibacteria group bacterium]